MLFYKLFIEKNSTMTINALIFDVDGTLANTEHDGHLRAFNEAFDCLGLDWYWDSKLYSELLNITGGKERMACYIEKYKPELKNDFGYDDFVNIHKKKTEIFISHVTNGAVSLRVGVDRLMKRMLY